MSVQHLGRLLESGDYKKCLEEAEALLAGGECDPEGLARIEAAICRSRLELTDCQGAVEAGRTALSLAQEAGAQDVVGQVLVDLATAESRIREYNQALAHFDEYVEGLPTYTAARCMEGIALRRMGDTLKLAGRRREAANRYGEARRWFLRYGDEESAMDAIRAEIQLDLLGGEPREAIPLLCESNQYAMAHPDHREFLSGHLLDQALFYLVTEQYVRATEVAFQALEAADDRLKQQSEANLVLCQSALAQNKPQEALSFALAARVSAIDGRLYDLEFEASDLLFRILQQRGARMLKELESDFGAAGVNLYDYVSERVVRRMLQSN